MTGSKPDALTYSRCLQLDRLLADQLRDAVGLLGEAARSLSRP